jgi:hypothetical protein
MRIPKSVLSAVLTVGLLVPFSGGLLTAQGAATPDQMVASLKQSLAESQKQLRQYQWIETTVISLKGEEKSRKQESVYYGADGTLTKLPMGAEPAPAPAPSGGRGRGRLKAKVVENKKDEMKEYMERASALIHQYVPPPAARVQAAKDAGHVQVQPIGQGHVSVEFQAFVQPGDVLRIDVDAAGNRLTTVDVKTYLDKPEDAVTLAVKYGTLTDGTSFVAQTTFAAAAKNISVVVTNTGHRPLSAR